MYRVVIPTAGLGTRVGPITKHINKALLTIDNVPAICNIIDKFSPDVEIIIILGYKGEMVKEVLDMFYPNRDLIFVTVDKYDGEGAGLGYTLNAAKSFLQCPFIFVSNDTIIPDDHINIDPNSVGNWIGYYNSNDNEYQLEQYRTINIANDIVTKINPKGVLCNNIYIGLCGVKDYKQFWQHMGDVQAITSGEVYGLKHLKRIVTFEMKSWCDTGNLKSLEKTRAKFNNEYNILEKENEAIWFRDGIVYKFSIDETFIRNRVERATSMKNLNLFPKIINHTKHIYTYEMIPGKVLSDMYYRFNLRDMLDQMNDLLWTRPFDRTQEITAELYDMYNTKTYDRVNTYYKRFEAIDVPVNINGIDIPTTKEQLDAVDWDNIYTQPVLSLYHGDFHNENIILCEDGSIKLIDWRQGFLKSNLNIGDVYYDLSKFYHGLIVNHHIVSKNLFKCEFSEDNKVVIDICRPQSLIDAELEYEQWLLDKNYNLKKVKILTALIFLNVAGLHEYHYGLFLYHLGKYLLHKWS